MIDIHKKLNENEGAYFFDMNKSEDAEYVLVMLGGKELLEHEFPEVYHAYQRTLKKAKSGELLNAEDKIAVNATNMTCEASGTGTKFRANISGFLCDTSIKKEQIGLTAPRPWQAANVTLTIADSDDDRRPPFASVTMHYEQLNDFQCNIATKSELDAATVAKTNLSIITEVVGADQDGVLLGAAFENKYGNHKKDGVRVVERIVLEDPKHKNEACNNPIIMLYGREADQNPAFRNADYKGGEYKENNGGAEGDKELKTLMPVKGTIVFKEGYQFMGLTKPDGKKKRHMYRPVISLNSSQVVKYYQDNWKPDKDNDMEMYEAIKDSFRADEEAENVCHFDLKIGGKIDWKASLKTAGQYVRDNNRVLDYQVAAAFRLDITDGILPATVDLTIQYTADRTVDLYMTTDGTSIVYIPAVRVYWGCIAKDSMIITDMGEKQIAGLQPGDRVLTTEGSYVTVAQMIRAEEEKIYRIRTDRGNIGLTGGHPLLLPDGTEKAAADLQRGDRLFMKGQEAAEVLEIMQEDYNDIVYNLLIQETKEGVFFYANGFAVGDTDAQNRPIQREEIKYTEEELRLQEEFERLCTFHGENR